MDDSSDSEQTAKGAKRTKEDQWEKALSLEEKCKILKTKITLLCGCPWEEEDGNDLSYHILN